MHLEKGIGSALTAVGTAGASQQIKKMTTLLVYRFALFLDANHCRRRGRCVRVSNEEG
jgi:hypothetical protein